MFAGYDNSRQADDIVYLAVNPYWESMHITLPSLPSGYLWRMAVNTGVADHPGYYHNSEMPVIGDNILLGARSVIVLTSSLQ